MTLFSRCDASQPFAGTTRATGARRTRLPAESGTWAALAGFAEDLGILFRYAVGLDYYSRGRPTPHR